MPKIRDGWKPVASLELQAPDSMYRVDSDGRFCWSFERDGDKYEMRLPSPNFKEIVKASLAISTDAEWLADVIELAEDRAGELKEEPR